MKKIALILECMTIVFVFSFVAVAVAWVFSTVIPGKMYPPHWVEIWVIISFTGTLCSWLLSFVVELIIFKRGDV